MLFFCSVRLPGDDGGLLPNESFDVALIIITLTKCLEWSINVDKIHVDRPIHFVSGYRLIFLIMLVHK